MTLIQPPTTRVPAGRSCCEPMAEPTGSSELRSAEQIMREPELLIPAGMSVEEAAKRLDQSGCGVAFVVDSRGRCVGVFTAADYHRCRGEEPASEDAAASCDAASELSRNQAVRYHITGQFTAVMTDSTLEELHERLWGAKLPFLVVLDRQARPRGIVTDLDVLVARSGETG